MKCVLLLCLLLGVALSDSPPANSINVASYGARGDGSDATSAIAAAIAASGEYQTIWFPSGTYKVTGITLKQHRTYQGDSNAKLVSATAQGSIFWTNSGSSDDITITNLIFENGNIDIWTEGTLANNLHVTHCTFQNNVNYCAGLDNCPHPKGIFVGAPGLGLKNAVIQWNTFTNIMSWWANNNIYNMDEFNVGIGIYGGDNVLIANNRFDLVGQGVKIYQASGAAQTCSQFTFSQNYFTQIHRMGIEYQCIGAGGTVYDGNYFAQWNAPNKVTFGISARADGVANQCQLTNNVFLGYEQPDGWYAYAIEVSSAGNLVITGNYIYGLWSTTIAYCSSGTYTITNNNICESLQYQNNVNPQYQGCTASAHGTVSNYEQASCTGMPALPATPPCGTGGGSSSTTAAATTASATTTTPGPSSTT